MRFGYIENGHSELTEQLEEAGAVVLDKEYTDLDVNGTQIRLGGMYDYAILASTEIMTLRQHLMIL